MSAKVQGYCPMGCGRTLFLGEGGYVTCSYVECPQPHRASRYLDDMATRSAPPDKTVHENDHEMPVSVTCPACRRGEW